MDVIIYTDGAARGNPGPAGAGWVILTSQGQEIERGAMPLGVATNNVAEYRAVIEALQRAEALKVKRVHLRSDSELLVKQLTNVYKVRNEGLIPLFRRVRQLSSSFDSVSFEHVPREKNRQADKLASEAAKGPDEEVSSPGQPAPPGQKKHVLHLRVRYGETDQMGFAYYANYLDWFTEARTALLREGGVSYKEMEQRHVYLPVLEANCQYLHPVRYEDDLMILTRVVRLTPARFDLEYTIMKKGLEEPRAKGWTQHAFMDEKGQPFNLRKRHPDIWERLNRAVEQL